MTKQYSHHETIRLSSLGLAVWMCALAGCALTHDAPHAAARVGPDVVFGPGMHWMQATRERCDASSGAALVECFAGEMSKAGASSAAVSFSRRLDQPGYVRDFRPGGAADVAYVVFPYRANENQASFLVNGTPALIDVDDERLLALDALKRDATYARMARDSAEVTLWPGMRSGRDYPDVARRADGGAEYVYSYRLRDRCHACAVLGTAWFAFEFDAQGRFRGTKLAGVTRVVKDKASAITDTAQPVVVSAGEEFSIAVAANRSTGYAWRLAQPLDTEKVRLVEGRYRESQARRPGAPGVESWTFGALQPGKVEIVLACGRPWEQDQAPASVRRFTIVIEPR